LGLLVNDFRFSAWRTAISESIFWVSSIPSKPWQRTSN
jgi:hypothetical protein